MNRARIFAALLVLPLLLTACGNTPTQATDDNVTISLQDSQILVDGKPASADPSAAVYIANDIVYYEEGKDFTYGEGTQADAHSAAEAAAHTVVHITRAGTYRLSGALPKGQIAVDLGEGAESDPSAVVTLILDGANITCEVAPAVIFYRVYECGNTDNPSKDVDTSSAGANVLIADGSRNTVNGWLVINGGSVIASACATSADAGIDSDMGIHINGGTVIAGGQPYAVFSFAQKQIGGEALLLKDKDGAVIQEFTLPNACSTVIYSGSALQSEPYTRWCGQLQLADSGNMAAGGSMRPDGAFRPGGKLPPDGGLMPPDGNAPPDRPQPPYGNFGGDFAGDRFGGEGFSGM